MKRALLIYEPANDHIRDVAMAISRGLEAGKVGLLVVVALDRPLLGRLGACGHGQFQRDLLPPRIDHFHDHRTVIRPARGHAPAGITRRGGRVLRDKRYGVHE